MKTDRFLISAHVDHEVEPPWDQVVEQKIATDPQWKEEWERQKSIHEKLAQLADPESLEKARELVRLRLDALRSAPRSSRHFDLNWVGLAAAAAVFGLVVGGFGFWLGRQATGASVAEVHVHLPSGYTVPLNGNSQLIKMTSFESGNR
ncbi:MAG: hypothetical protein HKM05_01355 [Spirochaetales bacterium]|nr:hypothetical protein [Spirochaetales bacterium]